MDEGVGMDVQVRLASSLAEIASVPGVDPRRCLKGPVLPKGISNLRVVDIVNLFLEGVVEQLQKPDEASMAMASSISATPTVTSTSSGRSSTRSTAASSSHLSASSRPKAQAAQPKLRPTRSASPPQPKASGREPEMRRLRQQAAQCQEFKDMADQASNELLRMEGELHELREQVARFSRQNKQLLLQLRQQRLRHRQELSLCREESDSREEVNLLTYLKGAPEQTDQQLQEDLSSHSADLRACLKRALRHILLEELGQSPDGVVTPLEGVRTHVKQLWAVIHGLWRSEVDEIVEEFFHSSGSAEAWPEVAENAEKQVLQMLERLCRDTSSPGDLRAKPYHVPEPQSAGSDDVPANEEVSRDSPKALHKTRRGAETLNVRSAEKLRTPSFGSPWPCSRSPSPSDSRARPTPNVPAVLMAGPVLRRARAPKVEKAKRSPEQSLSPRVPSKRCEVRPRSLSPQMAKRMSASGLA